MITRQLFSISQLPALQVIVVILIILFTSQLSAEEMSHGEMAGIIRSADHPCARVLDLQRDGENSWRVQCNSGAFYVTRNADGQFSVVDSSQ